MNNNRLVEISIIFIAAVLFFAVVKEFQQFLRPFVIAMILSFLFVPLTRFSKEKKTIIGLSSLAIVVVFSMSIFLIGSFVSDETSQIESNTNETVNSTIVGIFSSTTFSLGDDKFGASEFIDPQKISDTISGLIQKIINSVTSILSELFLVTIFLLFLLPTHDLTVKRISKSLTDKEAVRFKLTLVQIEQSIRDYLSIKSIVSLATAVCTGVILFVFGVKFAVLFSIMVFILNFIPSIGSFIAVSVIIAYELFVGGISFSFILMSVLLILVQVIFGNVIEPKYAGKQLELSPVVILLSLFFWGTIWGVGGMFFAIPLTSIIKIVLQNIKTTKNFVRYLS